MVSSWDSDALGVWPGDDKAPRRIGGVRPGEPGIDLIRRFASLPCKRTLAIRHEIVRGCRICLASAVHEAMKTGGKKAVFRASDLNLAFAVSVGHRSGNALDPWPLDFDLRALNRPVVDGAVDIRVVDADGDLGALGHAGADFLASEVLGLADGAAVAVDALLKRAAERPEVISFAGGLPAEDLFPKRALSETLRRVMQEHADEALQRVATAAELIRQNRAFRLAQAENLRALLVSEKTLAALTPEFVQTGADFQRIKARSVALADIKNFDGFIAPVPAGVDVAQYRGVLVWCEAFQQFITSGQYR